MNKKILISIMMIVALAVVVIANPGYINLLTDDHENGNIAPEWTQNYSAVTETGGKLVLDGASTYAIAIADDDHSVLFNASTTDDIILTYIMEMDSNADVALIGISNGFHAIDYRYPDDGCWVSVQGNVASDPFWLQTRANGSATAVETHVKYFIGVQYNITLVMNATTHFCNLYIYNTTNNAELGAVSSSSTRYFDIIGQWWRPYGANWNGNADETRIEYTYFRLGVPVADSCTAPADGDWEINCEDNCALSSAQDVPGNMYLRGSGSIVLSDVLTFTGSGQIIAIDSGSGELSIESGGELG